jgi:hypothetical protein
MPERLPRKRRAHHILTLHLIRKRPSRITADRLLGCVSGRPGPEKAPMRSLVGTLRPQMLIVLDFFWNLSTGP